MCNCRTTAWIEANGYDYDGPMFNICHVSPHEASDPSQFVTEVCYPVRKKIFLKKTPPLNNLRRGLLFLHTFFAFSRTLCRIFKPTAKGRTS